MEVKHLIKQKRIEKNLTILDVAKAVGVSEATVSRWESGDITRTCKGRRIFRITSERRQHGATHFYW